MVGSVIGVIQPCPSYLVPMHVVQYVICSHLVLVEKWCCSQSEECINLYPQCEYVFPLFICNSSSPQSSLLHTWRFLEYKSWDRGFSHWFVVGLSVNLSRCIVSILWKIWHFSYILPFFTEVTVVMFFHTVSKVVSMPVVTTFLLMWFTDVYLIAVPHFISSGTMFVSLSHASSNLDNFSQQSDS